MTDARRRPAERVFLTVEKLPLLIRSFILSEFMRHHNRRRTGTLDGLTSNRCLITFNFPVIPAFAHLIRCRRAFTRHKSSAECSNCSKTTQNSLTHSSHVTGSCLYVHAVVRCKNKERLIIIEVIFWQLFDVGHMNEEKKRHHDTAEAKLPVKAFNKSFHFGVNSAL